MTQLFHLLLALIASATDKELARYVEFLKEENKTLRSRMPGQIHTKPDERKRLLELGKPIGKRNGIVTAIVVVLLWRLIWSTTHIPEQARMMSADLAHLVAFPLGLLLYRLSRLSPTNQR